MNILQKLFIINLIIFNLIRCDSDKAFVIIIPSYNNSAYYKKNLDSVFAQNYKNYRIIYIDDLSPDDTANLVENYIKENNLESKITLIKNKKRQLALANIYKAVLLCKDNEIVVLLDGDDWFANNNVLKILNDTYNKNNIWITHGNFKYISTNITGNYYYDPDFPKNIISENKFREYQHGPIHLRTFYAWLFKQIKLEDLFYEGNFYKMTYDVAILLPMFEMARERQKFISEILYIYNDMNIINDHRVSVNLQHNLNRLIRQKNKYQKLEGSRANFLQDLNNIKTDVILFANNVNKINNLVTLINKNLINIDKLFVICDMNQTNIEFENIILINKADLNNNTLLQILNNIINNGSRYLLILDENINITDILDTNKLIKNLELTKAFAIYIGNTQSAFEDNIEIINNVYAFEYSKAKYVNVIGGGLYKKENINFNSFDKLEINWKFIGFEKICLFATY